MKVTEFSMGQMMAAARCSRWKIVNTAKEFRIEPKKTAAGHVRFTKNQAARIVRAIEEAKDDPRSLILGTEAA